MRAIPLPHRLFSRVATLLLLLPAAACGSGTTLPPSAITNVVDTTTLYALSGTAISLPSGFDVVSATPVRTDRSYPLDFAFDIDATGAAQLWPADLLGLGGDPGLLRLDRAFADVLTAPTTGYVTDSVLTLGDSTVFVARSRLSSTLCTLSTSLPRYGKFQVLSIDRQERSVTLEFLVDQNCGYRGLEPGLPDQ
jgi:hypothetical protein